MNRTYQTFYATDDYIKVIGDLYLIKSSFGKLKYKWQATRTI